MTVKNILLCDICEHKIGEAKGYANFNGTYFEISIKQVRVGDNGLQESSARKQYDVCTNCRESLKQLL